MIYAQMNSHQRSILVEIPTQNEEVENLLKKLTTDYHFAAFISSDKVVPFDGEIKTLKAFIDDDVKDGWDYFVNKPHIDAVIDQLNHYLN